MTQTAKPVVVFGGTFDPIHNGHLYVTQQVLKQLDLDHIRFVPCQQNVLKNKVPQASNEDRIAMLQLALADHEQYAIDERELKQSTPSYMIATLHSLKQELENPLYLLVSNDAFAKFDQWQRWEEILTLANLVITKRPDYQSTLNVTLTALLKTRKTSRKDISQYPSDRILLLSLPNPIKIAATEIRQTIQDGGDASKWLSASVWRYICDHKLYGV